MLTDKFGRIHDYLRISLTERCNLRCFYCMPEEGICHSPNARIMQTNEVVSIAKTFVNLGIKKIRLTGGEPLLRKDFSFILNELAKLGIELAITTNGVLIDKHLEDFTKNNIKKINVSLDSLKKEKFEDITKRNYFERIMNNINLLLENNISPKLNVVVIKGVNDDEIIDFIEYTRDKDINIQFIEYMPFHGNKWDTTLTIKGEELINRAAEKYSMINVNKIVDDRHDTSKKYQIKGFKGKFGFINTISNPFCDGCNRIRLTANGKIKNCLFSKEETDILSALRNNEALEEIIISAIQAKLPSRGGISDFNSSAGKILASNNRTMIQIGG